MVYQYYSTVDWTSWKDVKKILKVYENVLIRLEELKEQEIEWATGYYNSLQKWLKKDGFIFQNGCLLPIGQNQALKEFEEKTASLDAPEMQRQIERMKNATESDPSLAIGTAKELIETTCKTILEERKITLNGDQDLNQLVKATRKALDLLPDSIPDSAKGSDILRRLIGSLGTISGGITELRNLYGTGHGKSGKSKGLTPRHARLAVGAASTLATFLFETHNERIIK